MILFLFSCADKEEVRTKVVLLPADTISENIAPTEKSIFSDVSFLMGKFDPSTHPDFVWIDSLYTDKSWIFLQKEAYDQFLSMRKHALSDGIELKILSATRNFDYQSRIWERKWKKLSKQGISNPKEMALEILLYSAMPGTSRHHWGTDIDLNYLSNAWFEAGKGKRIYDWLLQHAADYGYCQPYTPKDEHRTSGYEEEKWHWSYMPLAGKYYEGAQEYLNDEMISGFSGAESAKEIGVVEKYILAVDRRCQNPADFSDRIKKNP
jgi:LAS superfamily LD-carboxypeptidase LdcB